MKNSLKSSTILAFAAFCIAVATTSSVAYSQELANDHFKGLVGHYELENASNAWHFIGIESAADGHFTWVNRAGQRWKASTLKIDQPGRKSAFRLAFGKDSGTAGGYDGHSLEIVRDVDGNVTHLKEFLKDAKTPCQTWVRRAKLAGLWDFDTSKHVPKAIVGNKLIFEGKEPEYHQWLDDDNKTRLNGVITTRAGNQNRIRCDHGITPQRGEKFVNQYSIVVDIHSPPKSRNSWRSIFQTSENNSNGGEYFIHNDSDRIGVGKFGYSTDGIDETLWTRLILTIDINSKKVVAYVNGKLHHEHTTASQTPVDGRFSLGSALNFFADGSGDNAPLNIGALAIYDGILSPVAVAALGKADSPIPEL